MKSKVILAGRFGNQLWQLAFAHFLVEQGVSVKVLFLDSMIGKTTLENRVLIENMLSACRHNIEVDYLDNSGGLKRRFASPESRLQHYLPKSLKVLDLRNYTTNDLISLKFPPSRNLVGYFQSRTLLGSNVNIVRDELLEVVKNIGIVSLDTSFMKKVVFHLRYGDYLEDRHRDDFGVLSYAYYEEILRKENLSAKEVLWISDDPKGVKKQNTPLSEIEVLGPEELDVRTTGFVMSEANLLAISNSSLAWWFGLCAKKRGAKVYLPHPWRKSEISNSLKSDVYETSDHLLPAKFV